MNEQLDDSSIVSEVPTEVEDEEAKRVREERLKAYAEKKSKKPALIAKTRYVSFSAFSWIVIEEELFFTVSSST